MKGWAVWVYVIGDPVGEVAQSLANAACEGLRKSNTKSNTEAEKTSNTGKLHSAQSSIILLLLFSPLSTLLTPILPACSVAA